MSDEFDELARQLRDAAAQHDPVPAHLAEQARQAFIWRTVDADLAEVTFDSWQMGRATPVRGVRPARLLTFHAGELAIEVELAEGRVTGQLVPPQPAEVELQQRGGAGAAASTDGLGRFTLPVTDRGPVRLRATARASGRW